MKKIIFVGLFLLASNSFAWTCMDRVSLLKTIAKEACRPLPEWLHNGSGQTFKVPSDCKQASQAIVVAANECLHEMGYP